MRLVLLVLPRMKALRSAQRISQSVQGISGCHDGDAFDLAERKHVFLVAGDDQVGFPRDCRRQDGVITWIGGEVYLRQRVEDNSACIDVLHDGSRFIGIEIPLQAGPGENGGDLCHLSGGRDKLELALEPCFGTADPGACLW